MKTYYKVILLTGFIAGSLDLTGAIISSTILNRKFPSKIFHYIASGVFGKEAFSGGNSMILWGLLFHYIIAYAFTFFYFLIYPKIGFLHINRIASGIFYGAFVWVIMNRIVVPLSNVTQGPFNITQAIVGMVVLMLMIGLPIAFNAHKYYAVE
ncbi:hypothetical protein [Emticicia agri]|uniref:DUF1440 domain-containing protein n=1 Tax=Emticicia agri TaxID=2492393 RepID=A0A4Q5LXX6_9BACT|nr:hypothetical protein [Emticicia agri]RYU94622.1 hypothetical protein EWM59_15935 [Emticicia agri]